MPKELAVAVIHGMGSQTPQFAQPMITALTKLLGKRGKDPDRIAWQPIYWQDLLEARELAYLEDARRQGNLDYVALRRLVVTALGDATAYQQVGTASNDTYHKVHGRIADALHELYETGLDSTVKPLVVMAHSLGCHMMSNYIWDIQRDKGHPRNDNPFERLEQLAGIITFGCNIPLFTFAHARVQPIEFPPGTLSPELQPKAKWLNFYDADDILGYPLKPVGPEYAAVVNTDIEVNVGSLLTSWNPASHLHYWTDKDFTRPAADFLASLLP